MIMQNYLPDDLYLSKQVREIDRIAIEENGISGFELMQKAARFSFHVVTQNTPQANHLIVLCGSGNNAGDGYIVAALANRVNFTVEVLYLSAPENLQGDAKKAYQMCASENVNCAAYEKDGIANYCATRGETIENCVIIDALLGTGLNTEVRTNYLDAITDANQSPFPILAVDIPSGLSADTGQAFGCAIEAQWTATFIGLKLGLFTGAGKHHSGQVFYDALDISDELLNQQTPAVRKLDIDILLESVPPRNRDTHKGQCGHTLIIGGDHGFGGAVIMAAESAARAGSGLTSVVTQPEHIAPLLSRLPEVMVHSANDANRLIALIERADAIVIGPGLGQSAWSEKMLITVLQSSKPIVFDADALNLISQHPQWLSTVKTHQLSQYIYTPHPGEAASMLNTSSVDIQHDRLKAIKELQKKWGGHFLLKGSGSLMAHPSHSVSLCSYGNPGMASGGMGDVLSGMIGSLVAQGLVTELALDLAVCLHAKAADLATEVNGERGLLAGDIAPYARKLLNRKTS